MGLTDIKQLLPKNVYDAAVGANSPSASNVFATISDLSGGGGIYGGSGSTQIGTTVVTMAATDVVRFDSLNGPQAGLFTIDAVNNRIGVNIAAPGYAFHLGSGDAYFQNGNVAIGTTPTLGYKLYLATDNTDGNNHRGQRIVLGGDSVTAAAQISGLEIRTLNTKTAAGTNNYRFIDINATGGATQGTYNLYGMRVKLDAFSNLGTATINKYIGEFVDGTEGLGKVLSDVTGGGLARWVDPNTLVSTPALSAVLAVGATGTAGQNINLVGGLFTTNNNGTPSGPTSTLAGIVIGSQIGSTTIRTSTSRPTLVHDLELFTSTIGSYVKLQSISTGDGIFKVVGNGEATFQANLSGTNRTIQFQDASGTVAYLTDIPTVSGVYLPLAGGTMTGAINMDGNTIQLSDESGDIQSISTLAGDIIIGSDAYALKVETDAGLNVSNGITSQSDINSLGDINFNANGLVLRFNEVGPAYTGDLGKVTLTANRTWDLPNNSGTVALLSDITGTNSGTNTGDQNSGTTFIISNDNTLRTINANSINGASLRDLVCTLIRDLNTAGVLTV